MQTCDYLMSSCCRCMHAAIGMMINQMSSRGSTFHFLACGQVLIKHNNVMMYLIDTISLSCTPFLAFDMLILQWIGSLATTPQVWCDFSKPHEWPLDASRWPNLHFGVATVLCLWSCWICAGCYRIDLLPTLYCLMKFIQWLGWIMVSLGIVTKALMMVKACEEGVKEKSLFSFFFLFLFSWKEVEYLEEVS